ncbi:MAG: outer membrane beta-barrel protein [Cyclobacteriaceae bacterium]
MKNLTILILLLAGNMAFATENPDLEINQKSNLRLGVGMGINLAWLSFSGTDRFDLAQGSQDVSVKETAFVSLHLALPGLHPGLSAITDIGFRNINTELVYRDMQPAQPMTFVSNKYRIDYLANHWMLRLTKPEGKLQPFVQLGVFNALVFSHEQSRFYLFRDGEEEIRETSVSVSPFRKYEFGLVTGGGIEYQQIIMELRFSTGNGFSNEENLKSRTWNVIVLVSYRF